MRVVVGGRLLIVWIGMLLVVKVVGIGRRMIVCGAKVWRERQGVGWIVVEVGMVRKGRWLWLVVGLGSLVM